MKVLRGSLWLKKNPKKTSEYSIFFFFLSCLQVIFLLFHSSFCFFFIVLCDLPFFFAFKFVFLSFFFFLLFHFLCLQVYSFFLSFAFSLHFLYLQVCYLFFIPFSFEVLSFSFFLCSKLVSLQKPRISDTDQLSFPCLLQHRFFMEYFVLPYLGQYNNKDISYMKKYQSESNKAFDVKIK